MTTIKTSTVTTSVVTAMPSYTAPASGSPVTASLPAAMPNSTVMDTPEVQGLAARVEEGILVLSGQQTGGLIKTLAALLASPRCPVNQLILRGSTLDAAGAAPLWEALKVNRSLTGLRLDGNKIDDRLSAAIKSSLKSNRKLKATT